MRLLKEIEVAIETCLFFFIVSFYLYYLIWELLVMCGYVNVNVN